MSERTGTLAPAQALEERPFLAGAGTTRSWMLCTTPRPTKRARKKPAKPAADDLVEDILARHPLTQSETLLAEALGRLFWSAWKNAAVWADEVGRSRRPGYQPGAPWWGPHFGQGSRLSKPVMIRGHVAGVLCGGLHPYRGLPFNLACSCPDDDRAAAARAACDRALAALSRAFLVSAEAARTYDEAAKSFRDARKRVKHSCDGVGANYLCIDLDAKNGETDTPERLAKVLRVIRGHGMVPVVFSSRGGIGAHVYLFFDAPMPTRVLHGIGRRLAREAGIDDRCDVFPSAEHEQVGNLIALPYCGSTRWVGGKLLRSWDGTLSPVTDLAEAASAISWFAEHSNPRASLRPLVGNPVVETACGLSWPDYLWEQGEPAGGRRLTPGTAAAARVLPATRASMRPAPSAADTVPTLASSTADEVPCKAWDALLDLRPRLRRLVEEAARLRKPERSENVASIVGQLGGLGLSVAQMTYCFLNYIANSRLLSQRDPYAYLKKIDDHQKAWASQHGGSAAGGERGAGVRAPGEREMSSLTSAALHFVAMPLAPGVAQATTTPEERRAWASARGDPAWSGAMDSVVAVAGGVREGARWLKVRLPMVVGLASLPLARTIEGWLQMTGRKFPRAATRRGLLPRILSALESPASADLDGSAFDGAPEQFGRPLVAYSPESPPAEPPGAPRRGRPRNESDITIEMLEAYIARAGGVRRLGASIKEKHQTLSLYRKGRSKVHERVARKLRAAFPDVDPLHAVPPRVSDAKRRKRERERSRAGRDG